MAISKSQKLLNRIGDECGLNLPHDAYIARTYASLNQRESGAWKWIVAYQKPIESRLRMSIGSSYSVTELLKFNRIYARVECSIDYNIEPK